MRSSTILFAVACCLAGACTPERPTASNEADANAQSANTIETAEAAEACPKLDIAWHAEVAAKDGERRLFVSGEGQMGTGGWQFGLDPGVLDEINPPVQHFTLTITEPAGDNVTQVVTPFRVESDVAAEQRYGAVVIDCRGKEYARITQIDRP